MMKGLLSEISNLRFEIGLNPSLIIPHSSLSLQSVEFPFELLCVAACLAGVLAALRALEELQGRDYLGAFQAAEVSALHDAEAEVVVRVRVVARRAELVQGGRAVRRPKLYAAPVVLGGRGGGGPRGRGSRRGRRRRGGRLRRRGLRRVRL